MKNFKNLALAGAILAFGLIAIPVHAEDSGRCLMAKMGAHAGKTTYGPVIDRAFQYLMDEEIPHILYGRKERYMENGAYSSHFTERGCSYSDSCGRGEFDISVSLETGDRGLPSVFVTPKSGSSGSGYIIIGKLQGYIDHEACSGSMLVDGNSWGMTYFPDDLVFKDKSTGKSYVIHGDRRGSGGGKISVSTSLSKVGYTIAKGYKTTVSSYVTGFADGTIIVNINDFKSAAQYQHFMELTQDITGVGG
ncbi:MAG: hypothetical protein COA85_07565 [Robiginitomaculum sp.]|nr:MAG: hypothetical protein COA85_07565 [Robiginitomaculum sp.]